jgi:hypothetical protein
VVDLQSAAQSSEGDAQPDDAAEASITLAHSLTREPPNRNEIDPDLSKLIALWPALPEGGRKLLRQTAEALTGKLPRKERRGKAQDNR